MRQIILGFILLLLVDAAAQANAWIAEGASITHAGRTYVIPDNLHSISIVVKPTVGTVDVCAYIIDPNVDATLPCINWTPGTISATDSSFYIAPIYAIKITPVGSSDTAKAWILGAP